jgi:hypothetical protein
MKLLSIRPEMLTSTSLQTREVKIRMWQLRVKLNLFCILSNWRKFRAFFAKALCIFSVPQYARDILGEMGVLYAVPARRRTSAFSQSMAFSICTYRPIPYRVVHLLQTNTPMHNHEAMYFIPHSRGTFTEGWISQTYLQKERLVHKSCRTVAPQKFWEKLH